MARSSVACSLLSLGLTLGFTLRLPSLPALSTSTHRLPPPTPIRSSLLARPAHPAIPPKLYMQASGAKNVVVTDMDETLITSKSTGYIIKFLVHYKAFLRLAVALPCAIFLIPLSKVSRSLAVRIMYWLAFRGIRVDKATQVA